MPLKAIVIGVECYSKLTAVAGGSSDVPGAVRDALEFYRWLKEYGATNDIAEDEIALHLSPQSGEPRARPATADAVRDSLLEMRGGAGSVSRTFFYFSGHGFSFPTTYNGSFTDVLAFEDYISEFNLSPALRFDKIREFLHRMNRCDQYFFLDCCRNSITSGAPLEGGIVGNLPPSPGLSFSQQLWMHVVRPGELARPGSSFLRVLLDGLRGRSAKERRGRAILVDFNSVRRHVERELSKFGETPDSGGRSNEPLYRIAPPPSHQCSVELRGSEEGGDFQVVAWVGSAQLPPLTLVDGKGTLALEPDEWTIEVVDRSGLHTVTPAFADVEVLEPLTVPFQAVRATHAKRSTSLESASSLESVVGTRAVEPATAILSITYPKGLTVSITDSAGNVVEQETGGSGRLQKQVRAGRYSARLIEAGRVVHVENVTARPDTLHTQAVHPDQVRTSAVRHALVAATPGEGFVPGPNGVRVWDDRLSLWISLIAWGIASGHPLETFSAFAPRPASHGESNILCLVAAPDKPHGELSGRPLSFQRAAADLWIGSTPARHGGARLSWQRVNGKRELATASLPDRTTLVVAVELDGESATLHQFFPLSSIAGAIAPEYDGLEASFENIRALHDIQEAVPIGLPGGRGPTFVDPVWALISAYGACRAADPGSASSYIDLLAQRFHLLPDVPVLQRMIGTPDPLPLGGIPIISDGVFELRSHPVEPPIAALVANAVWGSTWTEWHALTASERSIPPISPKQESPSLQRAPTLRRFVLVAGQGQITNELHAETARQLGRMLALANFGLITGGWPGVDAISTDAYLGAGGSEGNVVQVVPDNAPVTMRRGRVIKVASGQEEWIGAINLAQAVVLIGGVGGTLMTYRQARARFVPVIPLAGTRGDAEVAFEEILKDFDEPPLFRNLSKTHFKSLGRAVDVLGDVEKIVDIALSCLKEELPPEAARVTEQHDLLFLSSCPPGLEKLNTEAEYKKILESLTVLANHQSPPLVQHTPNAKSLNLLSDLNLYRPRIVHFGLHCSSDRGIALHEDDGGVQEIPGSVLRSVFRAAPRRVEVVVFNACASREQALQVVGAVDHIVATDTAITDPHAVAFAEGFYGALASRLSLETAVAQGNARAETRAFRAVHSLSSTESSDASTFFLRDSLLTVPAPGQPTPLVGISVSNFELHVDATLVGRSRELDELQTLLRGRKRVVEIVGAPGIGKTSLARMAVAANDRPFRECVCTSLVGRPPLVELLGEIIPRLSGNEEARRPTDGTKELVSKLRELVRRREALVLLDSFESILDGHSAGQLARGYEDYGELLGVFANRDSRCSLLITSRESTHFVRGNELSKSYELRGLRKDDCLKLLDGSTTEESPENRESWSAIFEICDHNPHFVRLSIPYILANFASPRTYLDTTKNERLTTGMSGLIGEVMARVTEVEKDVLRWLAVSHQPLSTQALRERILPRLSLNTAVDTMDRLRRRHIVQVNRGKEYLLQPMVSEWLTDELLSLIHEELDSGETDGIVRRIDSEVVTGRIQLLHRYALLLASGREYVKAAQYRNVVEPVARRLLERFANFESAKERIRTVLGELRRQPGRDSYAPGNLLNLLISMAQGAPDALHGMDFSGLQIAQADLQHAPVERANFSDCTFRNVVFRQSLASVTSVAWCGPDESLLAAGDMANTIHVWQISDAQARRSLRGHRGWITSLAWSASEQKLASGDDQGNVIIWDLEKGSRLYDFAAHATRVRGLAWSHTGQTLVSVSEDRTLKIWDLLELARGNFKPRVVDHADEALSVAISPDARFVATGARDGWLRIWSLASGVLVRERASHRGPIWALDWRGDRIATGGEDRRVELIRFSGRKLENITEIRKFSHTDGWVCSVALSPDGSRLFSASEGATVVEWDVASSTRKNIISDHTARVRAIALDSRTRRLASGSFDQTVKVLDLERGERSHNFAGGTNWVWNVRLGNGKFITTSQDGSVRLWKLDSDDAPETLHSHNGWALALVVLPAKRAVISGGRDGVLRKRILHHQRSTELEHRHDNWIWTIATSPDQMRIACASEDGTISIVDTDKGRLQQRLLGHTDRVRGVAFCSNEVVVSCGYDRSVRAWATADGDQIWRHDHHEDWVLTIAALSKRVASGDTRGDIVLAEVGLADATKFRAHCGRVWAIRWIDPDRLMTGSEDCTLKVWDVTTSPPTLLASFECDSGILSIGWFADTQLAVLGTQSGQVVEWKLSSPESVGRRYQIPRAYERSQFCRAKGLTASQLDSIQAQGGILDEESSPPNSQDVWDD